MSSRYHIYMYWVLPSKFSQYSRPSAAVKFRLVCLLIACTFLKTIFLNKMGSKKKLAAKLEQATHANSRRTRAVIRDIKKMKKRDIIKSGFASKVRTLKSCPSYLTSLIVFRRMLKRRSCCSSQKRSRAKMHR